MEENPALALFLALAIIILASRIGGSLARRFRQPRVLGELLVGVLLGPTFLNLLHLPIFQGIALEATIKELAELGVILLMFLIGFEVNVKELMSVRGIATLAGVLGALLPVGLSFALMQPLGYHWQSSLFVGVTLAATSVSISAQVLFELGFLRTKEGTALLATALIDDVLAILLVSLAVALVSSGESADGALPLGELGIILVRMAAYIGIAGA
ncbi:MAG: cation:proton antiporter, partial [Anaerolineae bacterium]|nr:cation:proton antiporter [Anaerolineae bacterium]